MFRKDKIEVVTPWTDEVFESEKAKYKCLNRYATRKEVALASIVPAAASVGFAAHQYSTFNSLTPITVSAFPQQQGVIADASLTALATILEPITDILVAISFPIASLIVVCSFFLIMIGNKEKAFDMMMHAGLGYILIQLSPVFLEILKTVGDTF